MQGVSNLLIDALSLPKADHYSVFNGKFSVYVPVGGRLWQRATSAGLVVVYH
jgi:hypothetical protein